MKKILVIFLIFSMLMPLAGCSVEPVREIESPYLYYYKTSSVDYNDRGYDTGRGIICPERREVKGHEGDLNWILADYLTGPLADNLVTPFPKGVELITCIEEDGVVKLEMDRKFSNLMGIELSVAASCIAETCFGLERVQQVCITVPGGLLDGKSSVCLKRDDIVLRDSSADMKQTVLTLYFSDQSGRYLIGEEITVGLATMENPCAYLMEKLADGPGNPELAPVLPHGTRVLGTSVEDGICYVRLSRAFMTEKSEDPLVNRVTLLAIANTLAQLDAVSGVELYEQDTLITSFGIWNLDAPLKKDENAVGPVRTGLNELDVDLYLPAVGQTLLTRIPCRVRQTASETPIELIVAALLSYPGENWVKNPFPAGVKLLSVQQLGNVCVVDVTHEFLEASDLEACVRSLVTTVSAANGGSFVKINVDGETPNGKYGSLFSAIAFHEDWILY